MSVTYSESVFGCFEWLKARPWVKTFYVPKEVFVRWAAELERNAWMPAPGEAPTFVIRYRWRQRILPDYARRPVSC